jgi:hypothetical protein
MASSWYADSRWCSVQYKLCKVKSKKVGDKAIPVIGTNDGRTFRYPDPLIQVGDTVKVDITSTPAKIVDFTKLTVGNLIAVAGGKNTGRVGVISNIEKHPGSFNIVHVKDAAGHTFATRMSNIFVIGKGAASWVTLPKARPPGPPPNPPLATHTGHTHYSTHTQRPFARPPAIPLVDGLHGRRPPAFSVLFAIQGKGIKRSKLEEMKPL